MKHILPRNNHGLKIIRRFDEDIWGILASKELVLEREYPGSSKIVKTIKNGKHILNYIYESYQNNFKYKRLLRFHRNRFFLIRRRPRFLYKIVTKEKEFKRKKRTLKTKHYLNMLKLRRFYGNLSKRKFRQLFKENVLNSNFLGKSFICLLEMRLDVILYRANYFKSIFMARQYISHQGVYINGVLCSKPHYKVNLNSSIFLKNSNQFYSIVKERLKKKKIFGNFPAYMEVNYKIGAVNLFKIPSVKEVPFPFFLNYKHVAHLFIK